MDDIILNPTHARFECCIKLAKRSLEGLLHLTADYVVFEKKKKNFFRLRNKLGFGIWGWAIQSCTFVFGDENIGLV